MENNKTKEFHRDVQVMDPVNRYKDFEYTFPEAAFPSLQTNMKSPPDCGEESYKGHGRLQGLKALITGGDSGIGRAVVIAFAREGAKVAINYLPEEEADAEDLARFLAKERIMIERIPGDLRDEKFCEKLVKQAAYRLGGLDVLVNNAGFASSADSLLPTTENPTEQMRQTYETNVFAPMFLVRAAAPFLTRGGCIIFTASSIVVDPQGFGVDYGSSKGAVTYLVRGMAQQLISQGIRVNGVAPGLTYTPLLAAFAPMADLLEGFLSQLPYGRPAQPSELAPLYVSLADPVNTYLSGEIYSCTGATMGA